MACDFQILILWCQQMQIFFLLLNYHIQSMDQHQDPEVNGILQACEGAGLSVLDFLSLSPLVNGWFYLKLFLTQWQR